MCDDVGHPPKTVVIARTRAVTGWIRLVSQQKFKKLVKESKKTTKRRRTR